MAGYDDCGNGDVSRRRHERVCDGGKPSNLDLVRAVTGQVVL